MLLIYTCHQNLCCLFGCCWYIPVIRIWTFHSDAADIYLSPESVLFIRMLLIYNRCPSPCPSCQIRILLRGPNSESDVRIKLAVLHFPIGVVCIIREKKKRSDSLLCPYANLNVKKAMWQQKSCSMKQRFPTDFKRSVGATPFVQLAWLTPVYAPNSAILVMMISWPLGGGGIVATRWRCEIDYSFVLRCILSKEH